VVGKYQTKSTYKKDNENKIESKSPSNNNNNLKYSIDSELNESIKKIKSSNTLFD